MTTTAQMVYNTQTIGLDLAEGKQRQPTSSTPRKNRDN